ncbi:MAG: ATP-dependent DNA ligase [Actinomycetota bacterium]
MTFPVEPPIEPMLSAPREEIPVGGSWLYEPKWDGFRAIVYRDRDTIRIDSRNNLPLGRYFPDVVDLVKDALPGRCVVDGEIVIAGENGLDFDALQLRLHPAASRVAKLAKELPASFVVFDLLALDGSLMDAPFHARRASLMSAVRATDRVFVTPQTDDPALARDWFERFEGAGLDGVIAKQSSLLYVPGERVMVKVKHQRTADCVVVGYRLNKTRDGIGSLVLGVYNDGEMMHIGFTSTFKAAERRKLLEQLRAMELGTRQGGPPSRWTQGKDTTWMEVKPVLVCEVAYDHLQGGWRFRHGARFMRWRKDKAPSDCTYEQFEPPKPFRLEDVRALR